ncbi:MAG: hypothetical protein IPL65_21600 [Lewinellaceae bacterium]|nr:hypothetical protein [Lewinellaceae bacterium]
MEEALLWLEAAICEGITMQPGQKMPDAEHLFGRQVHLHKAPDLSYMAGLAGGGLRTAAFLPISALQPNLQRLQEMARNHIPGLVICLYDSAAGNPIPAHGLKETGSIILSAASAQEALHLAIVGHIASEQSLAPCILLVDALQEIKSDVSFPDPSRLAALIGDTDDPMDAPNPAQAMIFGKTRRRIPNWNHFDYPTMSGLQKRGLSADLEHAAQRQFFEKEVAEIVHQAFASLQKLFPEATGTLRSFQAKDADYLILGSGPLFTATTDVVTALRRTKSNHVGCAHLALLNPLPIEQIAALSRGKKAISWLDTGNAAQGLVAPAEMNQVLNILAKQAPEYFTGTATGTADPAVIEAVFQNMMPKGAKRTNFFAGISFSNPNSAYPQHEILLQNIRRNYPEAASWSLEIPARQPFFKDKNRPTKLPLSVRGQKDLGPPYARISRFYQNTATLYNDNASTELVADPFQALPNIPAGTAGLSAPPECRTLVPEFEASLCTACGVCYVQCPHAALPPIAITVEQMLKGAMDIAAKSGTPATQLTPLLKNLGKLAGQVLQENSGQLSNVVDFLPAAFSRLTSQMNLEGDILEKTSSEMDRILAILSPISWAQTEGFFDQQELLEKGRGELFSLALDLQSCTGCGICADVCAPGALVMGEQTVELAAQAEKVYDLWELLPDTAPSTVQRQLTAPDFNPFAAVMLSRHNYFTVTGPGSNSAIDRKTMLHLITAVQESLSQPLVAAQYREIVQLVDDLAGNIRKMLGAALPAEESPD